MVLLFIALTFYSIYFLARMRQAKRRGIPWEQYKYWWE